MAKGGRKLTTSRSERYLGSYSYGESPDETESQELSEDDVWSMVDGMVNGGDDRPANGEWNNPHSAADGSASVGSRRRVARDERHVGGLSLAFEDPGKAASPRILHQFRGGQDGGAPIPHGRHMATSAPVNVPDWSKIYRFDSVESMHDSEGAEDGGDGEMVPPHEYLAREYRKMAANSVFEGVGRTLKGRDMSRVREAVWSQTGFDG